MIILGVIPARGGSKRLPGKNLRRLAGRSLLELAIQGAFDSKRLSTFVVSTDDRAIAAEARGLGATVIDRPKELAQDTTPMVEVFQHVAARYKADYYVCLQPTSPFREPSLIDDMIQAVQGSGADSGLTVFEGEPTGEVYVTTPAVLALGRLLGPGCIDLLRLGNPVNIDTEYDWVLAERWAARRGR